MRILHTGDIHLGELNGPVIDGENARMLDTVYCMNVLAQRAVEDEVDAILIAGDLFNKSKLWADEMLKEIGIASRWLRQLASVAPTVLMFGTSNHDNEQAFRNIQAMEIPNLTVITKPEYIVLHTKSGPLQVAAVPGFDKGYFRATFPGMDAQDENRMCSQLLGDIILGLGAQVNTSIPSVLMSHYTVVGCELDNGEHVFLQNDVVLPKEALASSLFDLVCLGHIHRAQKVEHCGDKPVFYCGSLNGMTFSEEGQVKGFWIHRLGDIEVDYQVVGDGYPRFIQTPCREFQTLKVDFRDAVDLQSEIYWKLAGIGSTGVLLLFPTAGKIVRVHYQCTEEQKKQLSHKVMEQALYKGGAFYVAEIKQEQAAAALTRQEMSENAGPMANLDAWLKKEGSEEAEITALTGLAMPLVAAVSANLPTGKLSGVFEPKRLEVKNYRSYQEEAFDFQTVTFATVNGPNGVGKSALFMDAICDCLFEEPREGDLAGWISNDDKARSGSITFQFGMGDTDWRVVRTRAKSGKTTLALQQLVNSQWTDRSGKKTGDTQEKIIALLGMDAMTFRCCALIMQDAYGLFMEADKTERMEVLANILGLNVYEQLTELAKAQVTEINRTLSVAKAKLTELDEKLKAVPTLKDEFKRVEADIDSVALEIKTKEAELRETEDLVRQLTADAEKAEDLRNQIERITREVAGKQQEMRKLQEQMDRAQKMLQAEPQILAKASELEQTKQQVMILKAKVPRMNELTLEKKRLTDEIGRTETAVLRVNNQIKPVEEFLDGRASLESAVVEYREAVTAMEGMDALADKWAALDFKWRSVRQELLAEEARIDKLADRAAIIISTKKLQASRLSDPDLQCIDVENANCALLTDAKQAKVEVQGAYEALNQIDRAKAIELDQADQRLQKELDALGYDRKEHQRLKTLVADLRPKAEQAAQLEAKTELLGNLMDQKMQYCRYIESMEGQRQAIMDEIQALDDELRPLDVLLERIPKLEQWAKAKEELPAARQVVTSTKERINAIEQEVAAKEQLAGNLEQERNQLLKQALEINTHRTNAANLGGQLKTLQDKQNILHAQAGGLKAKLDVLAKDEEEHKRVKAEMEPTAQSLVRYQTLSRAFGFDGIPFSIVRSVVPELSAMANDILGQMTGGKMSLEMRTERVQKSNKKEVNALEIWITDYQRGSLPYKSRSGGQKVKAALSVAFALADLKARRAGIQLGMMFVDEPPFLDAEGTEAYCDALELMSRRYPNMRVIAISHDPRMKSRFPEQIEVVDMGEEGSKVRVA